jgi:hypothetical protein
VKRHAIGGVVLDTLLTRDAGEGLGLDVGDGVAWTHDGQAFQCHDGPAPGTVPLRRVYHPGADQHVFHTDPARHAAELAAGARDEGHVCWVFPPSPAADWYGPNGSCALFALRRGGTGFYTLDAYLAQAMTASGVWRYFDHFVFPAFGRLGFAFSKHGACGLGDEGPMPTPGDPPPPPPPPAEEPAFVTMPEVGIHAGFRAWRLQVPAGVSSKRVKRVRVVDASPLPGPEFAIGFIPYGMSTADCLRPEVVWVDQGGTLEAAGLSKLTGQSTPPWAGLELVACAKSYLPSGYLPSGFGLEATLVEP